MALFGFGSQKDAAVFVRGEGFYLRPPEMDDFPAWARLRAASRDFLTPWEPVWPADDLTRGAFRQRLRRYRADMSDDIAYPMFLFRDDGALMGGLTLGQVRRGVSQTATLGYWMGKAFAGKGHMSQAVRAGAAFAFAELRLHRIEAGCVPENIASMQLLERCGFHREGLARAYLRINGQWRDHLLYALLENDPAQTD